MTDNPSYSHLDLPTSKNDLEVPPPTYGIENAYEEVDPYNVLRHT